MSVLFDVIKTAKGKSIEKVTPITHSVRYGICRQCDDLMITGNCKICGCFVKDKTKCKQEKCPNGKW